MVENSLKDLGLGITSKLKRKDDSLTDLQQVSGNQAKMFNTIDASSIGKSKIDQDLLMPRQLRIQKETEAEL